MKKILSQVLPWLSLFLLSIQANVVSAATTDGFGRVASNLMLPLGLMADFVYSASLVIGASFLFASLIKYLEHRRSPLMVPISTPIFLLIAGLALASLPFLSLFSDDAVRYSFFR